MYLATRKSTSSDMNKFIFDVDGTLHQVEVKSIVNLNYFSKTFVKVIQFILLQVVTNLRLLNRLERIHTIYAKEFIIAMVMMFGRVKIT